jgi:hypothetical protein
MSIVYVQKGRGMLLAIEASGHSLAQKGDEWVVDDAAAVQAVIDAYTLDEAKEFLCAEVARHAKFIRDAVIADISAAEMASWPIKLAQAAAYALSGNEADAPMLALEAQARALTLAELVAKVDTKAQQFAALEAQIAGVDGYHRDRIRALSSFTAVLAYDYRTGWPAGG